MNPGLSLPSGCQITAEVEPGWRHILSVEAVGFVNDLARRYGGRVTELLERREKRQAELDAGVMPDFLAETAGIRSSDWKIAGIPADLLDRRVEITGPTDRKMVINALNSGAKVFMADCEDSMTPSWPNVIQGQVNLFDAVRRRIEFTSPEGKSYLLNDKTATPLVRPRGWHPYEHHALFE